MASREVLPTRALQAGMLGILAVALVTRNLAALVNAVLGLGVTLLPSVLERDAGVTLDPRLTLSLTLAVTLHVLGMLGPYETVPWWDHLTHTLSATVVAGVGYAAVRAFDQHSDAVVFSREFEFAFVVLFTLALGVVWEVLEFGARLAAGRLGVDVVLVQYGLADTLTDLLFDALGAVAVALLGRRPLEPTVQALRERFDGA